MAQVRLEARVRAVAERDWRGEVFVYVRQANWPENHEKHHEVKEDTSVRRLRMWSAAPSSGTVCPFDAQILKHTSRDSLFLGVIVISAQRAWNCSSSRIFFRPFIWVRV